MQQTVEAKRRAARKVALVTGAASGIGRRPRPCLGAEGAAVVCCDVIFAGAQETAAGMETTGRSAQALALDVTAEPAWQEAVARVLSHYGRLDIAVNCADIASACPVADMSLDDWRRVTAVNLEGVVLGTKHAIRTMRRPPLGNATSLTERATRTQ